jgi:hypothetical protein
MHHGKSALIMTASSVLRRLRDARSERESHVVFNEDINIDRDECLNIL